VQVGEEDPAHVRVRPADPTPGIAGMTGYLDQAFAADLNDRIRDSGAPGPASFFEVADLDISTLWQVDPAGIPPRVSPFQVWQDGDVTITATLVDHRPTAPAFAYRFDTPDGSVVISGDTCPSENLIELAQGADVLVHEVIDPVFADQLAAVVGGQAGAALREHLLASHTTIEQVGRDVAEAAGVRRLVLSHMVPSNVDVKNLRAAQRGFSGELVIGEDLMQLGVGARG
jgi:ribonuclease BN (tRNA processing enzyme)